MIVVLIESSSNFSCSESVFLLSRVLMKVLKSIFYRAIIHELKSSKNLQGSAVCLLESTNHKETRKLFLHFESKFLFQKLHGLVKLQTKTHHHNFLSVAYFLVSQLEMLFKDVRSSMSIFRIITVIMSSLALRYCHYDK